jgi:transposase-like protein
MCSAIFKCPKCKDFETRIVYDHGKRKPVCAKCGTPFSDFIPDYRLAVAKAL